MDLLTQFCIKTAPSLYWALMHTVKVEIFVSRQFCPLQIQNCLACFHICTFAIPKTKPHTKRNYLEYLHVFIFALAAWGVKINCAVKISTFTFLPLCHLGSTRTDKPGSSHMYMVYIYVPAFGLIFCKIWHINRWVFIWDEEVQFHKLGASWANCCKKAPNLDKIGWVSIEKYFTDPRPLVSPAVVVCGLCKLTSDLDPHTCYVNSSWSSNMQISPKLHFQVITSWPQMTFDLDLWSLTAWIWRFPYNISKPSLVLIGQMTFDLDIWPLTSSTNEGSHVASMT